MRFAPGHRFASTCASSRKLAWEASRARQPRSWIKIFETSSLRAGSRVDQWIEVITTAHELGIPTTSTIMYGHVEEGGSQSASSRFDS